MLHAPLPSTSLDAQAAHAQREQLRVTLASIGDAVITTDAEGGVAFLNAVAEALLDWASGCIWCGRLCGCLLDLMMPVLNGWEFRVEQQRDPARAEIPLVILSADRDIARTSRELQVPDCPAKPVSITALRDVVMRYCH